MEHKGSKNIKTRKNANMIIISVVRDFNFLTKKMELMLLNVNLVTCRKIRGFSVSHS